MSPTSTDFGAIELQGVGQHSNTIDLAFLFLYFNIFLLIISILLVYSLFSY